MAWQQVVRSIASARFLLPIGITRDVPICGTSDTFGVETRRRRAGRVTAALPQWRVVMRTTSPSVRPEQS